MTIMLDWEPDTTFVANEDKVFDFGLPEPPRGSHKIEVKTIGTHPIIQSPVYFTSEERIEV